jgi:CheY-like chemotaxis protein
MPQGGKLEFKTWQTEVDDEWRCAVPEGATGRYAALIVRDSGEGLSEEAKAHLFEPFFTTKGFGKGTGLGLAMCYGIVKQNGGHIAAESRAGLGTTFSIYLPEVDAPLDPPSQRSNLPVQAGKETLLFAEDDDLVRHLAVTELASHGYRLIVASNGEEALRAAEAHSGDIHLLITDVIMPKMGGVELARQFRKTRPRAPVLYISGYTHDTLADGAHLLQKPFPHHALLARVRALLDAESELHS